MLIVHANFTEPNGISNSGIDFDACTSGRIKVYDQLLVSNPVHGYAYSAYTLY